MEIAQLMTFYRTGVYLIAAIKVLFFIPVIKKPSDLHPFITTPVNTNLPLTNKLQPFYCCHP